MPTLLQKVTTEQTNDTALRLRLKAAMSSVGVSTAATGWHGLLSAFETAEGISVGAQVTGSSAGLSNKVALVRSRDTSLRNRLQAVLNHRNISGTYTTWADKIEALENSVPAEDLIEVMVPKNTAANTPYPMSTIVSGSWYSNNSGIVFAPSAAQLLTLYDGNATNGTIGSGYSSNAVAIWDFLAAKTISRVIVSAKSCYANNNNYIRVYGGNTKPTTLNDGESIGTLLAKTYLSPVTTGSPVTREVVIATPQAFRYYWVWLSCQTSSIDEINEITFYELAQAQPLITNPRLYYSNYGEMPVANLETNIAVNIYPFLLLDVDSEAWVELWYKNYIQAPSNTIPANAMDGGDNQFLTVPNWLNGMPTQEMVLDFGYAHYTGMLDYHTCTIWLKAVKGDRVQIFSVSYGQAGYGSSSSSGYPSSSTY